MGANKDGHAARQPIWDGATERGLMRSRTGMAPAVATTSQLLRRRGQLTSSLASIVEAANKDHRIASRKNSLTGSRRRVFPPWRVLNVGVHSAHNRFCRHLIGQRNKEKRLYSPLANGMHSAFVP